MWVTAAATLALGCGQRETAALRDEMFELRRENVRLREQIDKAAQPSHHALGIRS